DRSRRHHHLGARDADGVAARSVLERDDGRGEAERGRAGRTEDGPHLRGRRGDPRRRCPGIVDVRRLAAGARERASGAPLRRRAPCRGDRPMTPVTTAHISLPTAKALEAKHELTPQAKEADGIPLGPKGATKVDPATGGKIDPKLEKVAHE